MINCAGFLQCFGAPFSPASILVYISIFDGFGAVTRLPWRGKIFFKNSGVLVYVIKKLFRLLIQLMSVSFRLQTLDENRMHWAEGHLCAWFVGLLPIWPFTVTYATNLLATTGETLDSLCFSIYLLEQSLSCLLLITLFSLQKLAFSRGRLSNSFSKNRLLL